MTIVLRTIILTTGSTWTVPADWDSTDNKIECIGGAQGGGFGGGDGGGGGAYTFRSNLTLTPGAVIPIVIGQGGAGRTVTGFGTAFGNPGTATIFNTGDTLQIAADFGGNDGLSRGGRVAACIPAAVARAGGGGGTNDLFQAGGGGGGAAGPHGAGADGGGGWTNSGSGGGGADGGGIGLRPLTGANGAQGGTSSGGTPGGVGGTSSFTGGGAGANGSGGGGGYFGIGNGGVGSPAPIWADALGVIYGPGSGGGSAGRQISSGVGGGGGRFGGGGGAGEPSGAGGQGVIVITYPSDVPPIPPIPPPPPPIPTPPLRERTYHRRFLGIGFDPTIIITKDRPGPIRIIEADFWMN